ncbi:flagella basal body P-ring formation protein FlgA [Erythrobacter sp. NE805]|uniref:flagella basal body P-ring formation protein FlgA n=1 Tax=Erythrobacter sp. NE805 TaxID=3389875 RepID=UPI00396B0D24
MESTSTLTAGWRFAPLALPMLLPLCDPAARASAPAATPALIDRAVAEFTGAAAGTPGGARGATDPRLQLAPCGGALAVSWQSTARSAVKVECPGPTSWRVFVALTPAQGSVAGAKPAPVVKRGEALTVQVRGRGFSVQQPGEALESGAVGDWIAVRTGAKSQGLRARIARPGLAIIGSE